MAEGDDKKPTEREDQLYIVSWNVASWPTTVDKLVVLHGGGGGGEGAAQSQPPRAQGSFKNKEEAVLNWFQSLDADILCLQETKIKKEDVVSKARDIGARNPNYDSFYAIPNGTKSFSTSRDRQRNGGLNGVATFAKKGLTTRACCTPLGEPQFDYEGRCLLTVHDKLSVFNVYVPNSGGKAEKREFKMVFLRLLLQAMQKQKDLGQYLVLCGDMNICYRAVDCHPSTHRYLIPDEWDNLRATIEQRLRADLGIARDDSVVAQFGSREGYISALAEGLHQQLCPFVVKLRAQWRQLQAKILEDREKDRVKKGDVNTGITASNAKASSSNGNEPGADADEDFVEANRPDNAVDTSELLRVCRTHEISTYTSHPAFQERQEGGRVVQERKDLLWLLSEITGESPWEARSKSWMSELIDGVAMESPAPSLLAPKLEASSAQQENASAAAATEDIWGWDVAPDAGVGASSSSVSLKATGSGQTENIWGWDLASTESKTRRLSLVDVVAEVHPWRRGMYTVWDQHSNSRYSNHGSRIDFTLVDKDVWQRVVRSSSSSINSSSINSSSSSSSSSNNACGGAQENGGSSSSATVSPPSLNPTQALHHYLDSVRAEYAHSLRIITNYGQFQGAPIGGDGIPRAQGVSPYIDHLRPGRGAVVETATVPRGAWGQGLHEGTRGYTLVTGVIPMPPEYSDHIATGVLLPNPQSDPSGPVRLVARGVKLQADTETRACQPHEQQSQISAFFKAGPSAAASSSSSSNSSSNSGSGNGQLKSFPVSKLPPPASKPSAGSFFAPRPDGNGNGNDNGNGHGGSGNGGGGKSKGDKKRKR